MKLKPILTLFIALLLTNSFYAKAQTIYPLSDLTRLYAHGTGLVAVDSTHFYYSGDRTSVVMRGIFNYDSSYIYVFNTDSVKYEKYAKNSQSFLLDSLVYLYQQQLWNDTTKKWVNFTKTSTSYDPLTGHIIGQETDYYDTAASTWIKQYSYKYDYDVHNNLSTLHKQKYDTTSGTWMDVYAYSYSYDAVTNNLDSLVYQVFQSPMGFVNQNLDVYRYDTSGNLINYFGEIWDVPTNRWMLDSIVNSSYTGTTKDMTLYMAGMPAPIPVAMDTFIYDANNNLLAKINEVIGSSGLENNRKYAWTYNTNNDPTQYNSYTWSASSSAWEQADMVDSQYRYYYNPPDTFTNVPVVSEAGQLKIFPVPAQNFLSIAITWTNAQPFSISMYDMAGRLMKYISMPATFTCQKTIPINDISAGEYIISIKGTDSQLYKQIAVIK